MPIDEIEDLGNKIILHIHQPKRYGGPDDFFERIIDFDSKDHPLLPEITMEEIVKLPNDKDECKEAEYHKIPRIGIIVLINDLDMDSSSATYRQGAIDRIDGPYLLVGKK